jgi:hypothetical protein
MQVLVVAPVLYLTSLLREIAENRGNTRVCSGYPYSFAKVMLM